MKNVNWKLALAFALTLSGFFAIPAYADGTYIGEACWIIETDEDEEPSEAIDYVKLAVSDIGDNHFTLNGYSFSSDDESVEERMLLSGNAEIFGEQVFLNMNGLSSNPDEIFSIAARAILSASTLSGSIEIVGAGIDRLLEESGIATISGTLTITECPD